jgi:hypothetical protein
MIGGTSKNVKHRGHRGSERNVEMPCQVNIGEGARGPSTSQVLALGAQTLASLRMTEWVPVGA